MEDLRTYREEEKEPTRRQEEEARRDFGGTQRDDEVPFHIPRD